MIRVGVAGAAGRMGRVIVAAVSADADCELTAALERADSEFNGLDSGELAGTGRNGIAVASHLEPGTVDVVIDFTAPCATVENAAQAAEQGHAMVIGTTGLSDDQRGAIDGMATRVPIVLAPNMSAGVTLCLTLLETAARALGDGADIEVFEVHHRHKVDAPSGTALRMGEVIAQALGRDLDDCAVYARQGITGPREPGTIGFSTMRGGDVVGEHSVVFALDGERVEIGHKAQSRATFAGGALRSAKWVVERPPGRYDMTDVLGLR